MNSKLLILCLACYISHCWADKEIVLKPDDPFLFLGDCLTLTCTLSSTQNGNSSTLFFTLKGKNFSDDHYEIVDEKTVKFKRCINDLNEAGTYFCKQNNVKDNFSGQVVHVEKPLVQIPKDSINCTVLNWTNMNCSWSLGKTYNQKNEINVSLVYQIVDVVLKCPKLEQTSCQWTNRDADLTMPFQINVTVFHRRQPEKKFLTVFNLARKKRVKPAKVSYSEKSTFTNSSCVYIEWKHNYAFRLKFYVALSSNFQKENVTLRSRSKLFCDLLPGEKYKISISAYPKRGLGIWSDPLIIEISTNETYPSQPPLLTDSSFVWVNNSAVYLYWQSLTRRQYGAAKVWYLTEFNNNYNKTDTGNVLINLPPHKLNNKCWFLQVWAENRFGRSKNSSSIRICNSTAVPPSPENVEMLILNKTHVKIMWIEETSVSSFQVFISKNRSADLQWLDVDNNKTFMILPLENGDSYYFGVSAKNSYGSTGITWGSCFYQIKKPQKPVELSSVNSDSSKIQISWYPYNCYDEKAFIIGYNVKYCTAHNETECSERAKEKLVPKSQGNFQTSELSPNDYLVWVEPITYSDPGPSSKVKMVKISDTRLATSIIIVIAIAAFILFIFIIFGCKHAYNKCSSQLAKCDPKLDFPQVIDPDYKEIRSDNCTRSDSGEQGSPVSSIDTVITDVPDSSLPNSTKEISDSSQHIYTKVEAMSSDSQESPRNSCTPPKAQLHFTSKQNANNNAVCAVNTQEIANVDYVDLNYSSEKCSVDSQDELLQDSSESTVFSDSSCSDSGGHFQIHLDKFLVPNPENGQNDDYSEFVGQTPTNELTEVKDREENLPNENYFNDYISENGINKSSVSEKDCDSLPSNISEEKPENDCDENIMFDDYLSTDKVFKLKDFCAEKVKIKQKTDKNNSDVCELHEMSNKKVLA